MHKKPSFHKLLGLYGTNEAIDAGRQADSEVKAFQNDIPSGREKKIKEIAGYFRKKKIVGPYVTRGSFKIIISSSLFIYYTYIQISLCE